MLRKTSAMGGVCCSMLMPLAVKAGDPPAAPPASTFVFNFLPLQARNNVDVFAACGIGNLRVGIGAKGEQMCDDNMGGPGEYKERFVHDGYIPNNTEYLLEQKGDLFHQVLIDYAQNWKMETYIAAPPRHRWLHPGPRDERREKRRSRLPYRP